jgi:26S proteasome non-ATPase regulatory subunit 10
MRLLLKVGAKVNAKDKTGSTPLHRAASAGCYDTAAVLVEEGRAKIDSHDKTGSTPLLVAVSCGQANIAIYLASKGADLEVSGGGLEWFVEASCSHTCLVQPHSSPGGT